MKGYNTKHTIAAIATYPSVSALGVIKISGEKAISAVKRIFVPKDRNKDLAKVSSYTLHYGWIVQPHAAGSRSISSYSLQAGVIDEVLVSVMRAPHSYTREDVVEISSHGGVVILNKILGLILKLGARLAKPGEFSYRAFLNGRLDLAQAQAVGDIVNAKSEKAMFSLSRQIRGDFSLSIISIRDELKSILSSIEAWINFPDEDIVIDSENIKVDLGKIIHRVKDIIEKAGTSKILRDGISCVICGRTNTGKSTLFNKLLGEEKAIVTHIPGTTRDAVEEIVNIRGLPIRIYDTAGILKPKDFLDERAVSKSYEKIKNADLVIIVFDASRRADKEGLSLLESAKNKNAITVINKIDLTFRIDVSYIEHYNKPIVKVSALKNIGIDKLEEAIFRSVYKKGLNKESNIIVLASWQIQLLKDILSYLSEAEGFIKRGFTIDFAEAGIRNALESIYKLTGEEVNEEILTNIFSNFCIGK